jgi:hypothetical protein
MNIASWAVICLAVWLILAGVVQLFNVNLGGLSIILPILMIISGILFFLGK